MSARIAVALLLVSSAAFAQPRTYEVRPGEKSTAQFHAEDTYDAFDGSTNKLTGSIVADAAAPSTSTVSLTVDINSLDTGVALRNKEMRERYLQTNKFPEAKFTSVSVSGPPSIAPNAPAEISITGDFAMHGITKRMTIPVRVVLIPDGRIHVTSLFNVKLPDFGVDVPKNVLVTVNDEVAVRLDVWASERR